MELAPGRLLGRFGVEALLGSGASGVVYRARDRRGGGQRALKVLRSPSPAQRARFEREVDLLRAIRHPNVVGLLDVIEVGGAPALVLEYVPGPSLREALAAGTLSPADVHAIARGVMAGVGALHEAGVVHRDLKPANILLAEEDGRLVPKVADLGVARRLYQGPEARLTQTGEALGTPPYMAPEQLRDSSRAGSAADIWALGVMLYEMVCGRRPFPGDTIQEIADAICRGPPAPRSLSPDLPDAWAEALCAALLSDPSRRPSAETMAALWGAVDAAAPTRSPTRAVGSGLRHNLPWEADDFVGREDELSALAERLAPSGALVSVVGTAGVGKTRLVRRFAWEHLDGWPGGVWFCDLSEARGLEGVCFAVALTLNVPLSPRQDPAAQLGHAIAGRGRCLVILDNFEQVARHAQDTLERWRAQAGEAAFLVTSRAPLALPGEQRFALAPLPLPPEAATAPADVQESAAVALFVARSRQAVAGFALTRDNERDVARLVAQLDGLPLAIELAAARARLLSPTQILSRMHQRFRLLASSKRGGVARQSTLWMALEWSWDLLSPLEQLVFAQCGAFEGGFTAEAARAVIHPPGHGATLRALSRFSLLREETLDDAGGRFVLYRSLQAFAREKLRSTQTADGPLEASALRRHGVYYASFGTDEALRALRLDGGTRRTDALAREIDNLVTASRRAARLGDAALAAPLALAATEILQLRGPGGVGIELLLETLALTGAGGAWRLRVLLALSKLSLFMGRHEGVEGWLREADGLAAAAGDLRARGDAQGVLGILHMNRGEVDQALSRFEEAQEIHGRSGDVRASAMVLNNLGALYKRRGQMDEARGHYEAALSRFRGIGDRRHEGSALGNLGTLDSGRGRPRAAMARFEAALSIHREIGNRRSEGIVLISLGVLQTNQGQLDAAEATLGAALRILREIGNRRGEGTTLGNLGNLRMEEGAMEEARGHYEAALAVHREVGNRHIEPTLLGCLGILHKSEGRPDEARACYEGALAMSRRLGNRRSEGILLGNLANLHRDADQPDAALTCFQAALAIHREVGNRQHEGQALLNLGTLYRKTGRPEAALAHYDAALVILKEVGARRLEGVILSNTGYLHQERGDWEAALASHEASLAVYRDIGNQRGQGYQLESIGSLHAERGQWALADASLARGEALLRAVGDRNALGQILCVQGQIALRRGRSAQAASALAEAAALARALEVSDESELGGAVSALREELDGRRRRAR